MSSCPSPPCPGNFLHPSSCPFSKPHLPTPLWLSRQLPSNSGHFLLHAAGVINALWPCHISALPDYKLQKIWACPFSPWPQSQRYSRTCNVAKFGRILTGRSARHIPVPELTSWQGSHLHSEGLRGDEEQWTVFKGKVTGSLAWAKWRFLLALFTEPDEPFQLTFSKTSMGSFSRNT